MAFRGSGGVMGGARGALRGRGGAVSIVGMEDLENALVHFMPREAKNILKRTTRGIAATIRKEARRNAPKNDGVLKKAIVSKGMKGTRSRIDAGVYVTHGRGARWDAWYWFFHEWGTIKHPEKKFITNAIESVRGNFNAIFRNEFGKQLEKEMVKRAKRMGKA